MSGFSQIIAARRSIYNLDDKISLTEPQIIELVNFAVTNCPTAFNSQSSRVVVLFNENQQKFWDLTLNELKKHTPAEKFPATRNKIESFAAARGTILFFEDQSVIQNLQKSYPLYKDNFPVWSQQGSAILQYTLWCLLTDNQIGASLQHYSPLVDEFVSQEWKLPSDWKLIAQMPFGRITAPAGPKEILPLDLRVKIFS